MTNSPNNTDALLAEKINNDVFSKCKDFDSECVDVRCKTTCWLYQPERGYCPFLIEQSNK